MSTGRAFYKNVQTGETTWDAPDPLRRRSALPLSPLTQEALRRCAPPSPPPLSLSLSLSLTQEVLRRESAIVAAAMSPPVRASVYQGSAI